MMTKMTRSLLASAMAALVLAVGMPTASAGNADSCTVNGGTRAECIGSYSQHTAEDFQYALNTNCYGSCGPGCSMNCSSGGACTTHDYNTRKYGMFSSQAMSVFPPALVKWGGCQVGRAVQNIGTNVFSRVTSVVRWGTTKLSGLF
jgi:hypothetical protein